MRGGSSSASEVAARRSIGKGDSDGRHYLVRALQVTGLHSLGGASSLGGLAGGLAGNRRLGGTLCLSVCGQNRKSRGPRCHEIEAAYSIGRPTARGGKVNSLVSTGWNTGRGSQAHTPRHVAPHPRIREKPRGSPRDHRTLINALNVRNPRPLRRRQRRSATRIPRRGHYALPACPVSPAGQGPAHAT